MRNIKNRITNFSSIIDYAEYGNAHRMQPTLLLHGCSVIAQLRKLGQLRTSETYLSALRSFMLFREWRDLSLNRLTSEMMLEYEAWLQTRGVSMNTVSFYMRILRALYNRAIESGIAKQHYPFKHVYTGVGKTLKRAVSINDIRRIKRLDLSARPALDFARDMFLFSFYTRGMSFVDQMLHIRWERCMQHIVDKYPDNGTCYLLPIICAEGNDRRQYQNAMRLVNCRLKRVAVLAGIHVRLTMYVSRHSWASIARSMHIPISVISEGMGHDSEATTQIYLASLDPAIIDRANGHILRLL